MASELSDIPHNMRRLYRRFQRWRSAHTGRLPIPERLWAAATELAREHGVFPTAKDLRLEYGKLKQRVEEAVPAAKVRAAVSRRTRSRPRPPRFVELLAPRPGGSPECRVELEGPRGRMRVDFKGIARAEWVALSRALWNGETREIGATRDSDHRTDPHSGGDPGGGFPQGDGWSGPGVPRAVANRPLFGWAFRLP